MRFALALLLAALLAPPAAAEEAADRIALARERLRFLAEAARKFEAETRRPPRAMSDLRRVVGPGAELADPWGRPFQLDPEAGILRSLGPDGKRSAKRDAPRDDDLELSWRALDRDPGEPAARRDLERLLLAVLAFRARETREIESLADLAFRDLTSAAELRDPWGNPYVLDPAGKRLLSAGPDGGPGDDDLSFSYDTNSNELKSWLALRAAAALAATVEARIAAAGCAPARLADLLAEGLVTGEALLLDSWGRPYRLDTAACLVASAGPDGVFDAEAPGRGGDDLAAGFAERGAARTLAAAAAALAELGRAALRHRVFTGRPAGSDLDLASAGLPSTAPRVDPFGTAWRFDPSGALLSAGPDGSFGTADDLRFDPARPPRADADLVAAAAARHLAGRVAAWEKERRTRAVNLLSLGPTFEVAIYRMRDPWGNPFHLEPDRRFVYSMGADGLHTMAEPDATWEDDLTAPVALAKPEKKAGTKQEEKEKGKNPGKRNKK